MTTEEILPAPPAIITNYTIDIGRKGKMYTLWVERSQQSTETTRGFYYIRFVRNLSVDMDEAVRKAVEITGVPADQIEINDVDTSAIVYGEDVLRFGKYEDQRVGELTDEKYLSWLAKGGPLKHERGYWYNSLQGDKEKFVALAQDRLLELNYWAIYKGQPMPAEKAAKLKAKADFMATLIPGHHMADGDRVRKMELRLVSNFSFDTVYGTTYIAIFCDDQNRIFKYKGSKNFWRRDWENEEDPGDIAHIVCDFTVAHDNYKEAPETMMKRPKIHSKQFR